MFKCSVPVFHGKFHKAGHNFVAKLKGQIARHAVLVLHVSAQEAQKELCFVASRRARDECGLAVICTGNLA